MLAGRSLPHARRCIGAAGLEVLDDADFPALGLPRLAERLANIAASSADVQQKTSAEAIERAGAEFPCTRTYPALARSGMPVLLLHATEPAAVTSARSQLLTRFVEAIPQAEVVAINGAAHDILADAEDDVLRESSDFSNGEHDDETLRARTTFKA